MPKPNPKESRNEFVKRCIPIVMEEGSDQKAAVGKCEGMYTQHQKKSKKEVRYSRDSIIEFKQDDNLIVKGYIATTHFDGQDVIQKETLDKWATEINQGNPRANKVSINHDRQPHVAGVGLKGTATVHQFQDNEYGLYVETLVDKTKENYEDTVYRIENNLLDSFSIEYVASPEAQFNEAKGARVLGTDTELHGWTIASQPMNEHAVMIKELINSDKQELPQAEEELKTKSKEVNKMTEQETQTVEVKEAPTLSDEDAKLLQEAKEMKKSKEMKEQLVSMLKDPELKEMVSKIEVKEKPLVQEKEEEEEKPKEEENPEEKQLKGSIEYLEMKQVLDGEKLTIEEKFRRAGAYAEKKGFIWAEGVDKIGYKESKQRESGKEFKTFGTNGAKLEFKSLGITTNQNTDTDYLLSAAELRDVFDPVIYDTLNQSTVTWGLLRKDDFSNKGNNQVQFVLRTGLPNQTAAFYTGNSVSTDKSTLLKVQTQFKKVQVGVSVDGDMIAAARGGPISDVFATHVRYGTEDMLTVVNTALFAEAGAETAAACIGFEYITDSAGNTTLYNLTRYGDKTASTYNGLSPTTATDTYINQSSARISLDNLRKAIEQATKEGASINNLVFITHPTQERLFKGIYDASQRLMPTSSRFGFEGRPEFDSVPVFADKDCNTDDWWLVDLESHRVAMWVPPTLEMLGKRSDAEEGFVKMYFATYNNNPRRMVQIYGCATS